MILDLFAPLAMKIAGGIALALAVALGVTLWRADTIAQERDEAVAASIQAELQHRITAASLAALASELEAMVAEGEARADRVDAALDRVARDGAATLAQADDFDIETVEGL